MYILYDAGLQPDDKVLAWGIDNIEEAEPNDHAQQQTISQPDIYGK